MSTAENTTGLAEVLAAHERLLEGWRNLGQYRTEWTCACGATYISDGHAETSGASMHRAHVADMLTQVIEAREVELRAELALRTEQRDNVGRLAVEQAIAAVEARRERDAARAKLAARIAEGGDQ